ncbi:MAG: Ig-like domain-containing protein, partial [Flavisolibacter sp.]
MNKIVKTISFIYIGILLLTGCNKKSSGGDQPVATTFILKSWTINGATSENTLYNVSPNAPIRLSFSSPIDRNSVPGAISITRNGTPVTYNATYTNADSVVILTPATPFSYLTKFHVDILAQLRSPGGATLYPAFQADFVTSIDSSDKFPVISDSALVQLVQQQTFKYFWDFGHPVSGLARERNTSGDVVTSGGSGFGIMAIITGIQRNFISRAQGVSRIQTMVSFLKNTAQKFHGAFPHWLNGVSGAV